MKYSISIVSHHSGEHLKCLIPDLVNVLPKDAEIILTINTPEDEGFLKLADGKTVNVIRNTEKYGFGENHNRAFARATGDYFIVINPDIRLDDSPFEALAESFKNGIGACVPVVLSQCGGKEDSIRKFPTFGGMLKRFVTKRRTADYVINDMRDMEVDWAAGMFMMFDSAVFKSIGGFNARYFMYMEDVDICRRLALNKYKVVVVPRVRVVHNAQRASAKSWQHFKWHARSAFRYFFEKP